MPDLKQLRLSTRLAMAVGFLLLSLVLAALFGIHRLNRQLSVYATDVQAATDRERAVALYLAVRDGFRYDPYRIDLSPQGMTASTVLTNGYGWCVPKAALLTAACRAAGIPARIGFADVISATYISHHGKPVGLQGALQQEHRLVGLDGGARGQGHRARQRWVQHVRDLENVTQDGARHLCHRGLFEVE